MKKFKQIIVLLLVVIFLISGCTNNEDKLNEPDTPSGTLAQNPTTDDETKDVAANNSGITYDYHFSIYDDGRSFGADQISVQSAFESFLNEIFVEEMSASTISLHFTIEHPENYGISDSETNWGNVEYLDIEGNKTKISGLLTRLSDFNYDSLTYEQQLIYEILKSYLENELNGVEYVLYSSAFGPTSGLQGELPIIFSEYNFLSKEDIDDYIELLDTSYDYISQLCDYEMYRLENGFSLSTFSLDRVIEQCNEFINSNPNCIQPIFESKLNAFTSLTNEEKESYMDAFEKALSEKLIPGYKLIVSTLTAIRDADKSNPGLCNYDNGKSFYEYIFRYNTGSARSIDEIYKMMEDEMSGCMTKISSLFIKNPNLADDMTNYTFPEATPKEMLDGLLTSLEEDFPSAVNNNYTINYVPKSLQSTMSPAFYLIPPIDNINRNIIYINQYDGYSNMNLYPTIAHEGFPGHMYQTNYFYSLNPHYFRSLLSFNGYSEGWAQYIETCYSYKYSGMDNELAKAFEYNTSFSFALYCMTDIGINYYGWDYDDTAEFLSTYVGNDENIISEVYYTMADEPCIYLRYYVGYLEILSLKEKAMETLGSGFDIKEFHKFILEIGPCQFDIIEDRMEGWMDKVINN